MVKKQDSDWQASVSLTLASDEIRAKGHAPKQKVNQEKGGAKTGWLWVLVLLLLCSNGAGFWYGYKMQQTLDSMGAQTQQKLAALVDEAQNNKQHLEKITGNISQTTAKVSASGNQFDDKLKKLASKLENENKAIVAKLHKLQSGYANLKQDYAGLSKLQKASKGQWLGQLKTTQKRLEKSIGALTLDLSLQADQLASIKANQQKLLAGGDYTKQIANLEKRMQKYDTQVKSMDQYRQQINRQILSLQSR